MSKCKALGPVANGGVQAIVSFSEIVNLCLAYDIDFNLPIL